MTTSLPRPLAPDEAVQAIARRCEAGETAAADLLHAGMLIARAARRVVRVRIIPALRAAEDPQRLVRALQLWLEGGEGKVSDLLLLAAAQRAAGLEEAAGMLLERLARDHADDPAVMIAAIQQALQQGRNAEAARLADTFTSWRQVPARAVQLGMTALLRAGMPERAIALGHACTEAGSGQVNAALADAHTALNNTVLAARHAQRAIAAGYDTAGVRILLAKAACAVLEHDRSIVHLNAAVEVSPDNVRALTSLGELLLTRRRPKAACIYLQRAVKLAPDLVHPRVLLARALKDQGNYAAAASGFDKILLMGPDNPQHCRQAAGIYRRANRLEDAARLMQKEVTRRRKHLPASLEAGLEALWSRTEEAAVSPARLQWAWAMRSNVASLCRQEWERRARWGWLADRLLQEWLEVSPDRAEEAMLRLADLGPLSQTLEPAARSDGPLILATTHLGPLFAGPLALQLLDLRCSWLASTPSMEGMAYSDTLISTSDQSESQVVRASLAALESGISLGIAVDGAMTMAAPRVVFEGQEITYTSFAARLAYRKRSRAFFVTPQWQDCRICFDINELPRAEDGEPLEPFLVRWREACFVHLRRLLQGEPENLRLSGGIWRHVRPLTAAVA